MRYEDIIIQDVSNASEEDLYQASELLRQEFPEEHKDTSLKYYAWAFIAKKSSLVVGLVTGNRYLPNKAILCDLAVKQDYRGSGVAIKLLKSLGEKISQEGIQYLVGFTPRDHIEALDTYRRVHTTQEEYVVTTSHIPTSLSIINLIENRLKHSTKKSKLR